MAYITFLAKGRDVASHRLTGTTTLGRSLDCDLFVPDVFVSRQHCRFEKTPEGWVVEDLGSRNGIYFRGRGIRRRVLHHNDTIELGTIGFQFDEGELPPNMSSPAPFGTGSPVAELVETLFADGLRPAEFTRRRKRKPAWSRRHGGDAVSLDLEELETLPEDQPPVYYDEWTELDVETAATAGEGETPLVTVALRPLPQDLMERARAGDWEAVNAILDQITSDKPVQGVAVAAAAVPRANQSTADTVMDPLRDLSALLPSDESVAPQPYQPPAKKSLWQQAFEESEAKAEDSQRSRTSRRRAPAEGKNAADDKAVKGTAVDKPSLGERLESLREFLGPDMGLSEIVYRVRERPFMSSVIGVAAAVVLSAGIWYANHISMPPQFDSSGKMHHAYIPGPEN